MSHQITGYCAAAFRGIYAAASLKLRARRLARVGDDRFPRHLCRGLIEALRPATRARCIVWAFRGIYAAASLKQDFVGVLHNVDDIGPLSAASMPRPH